MQTAQNEVGIDFCGRRECVFPVTIQVQVLYKLEQEIDPHDSLLISSFVQDRE